MSKLKELIEAKKTTTGRLKEILVLETDKELIVFPAGIIVEISSEDDYPHEISDKQMDDAVEYLKNQEE